MMLPKICLGCEKLVIPTQRTLYRPPYLCMFAGLWYAFGGLSSTDGNIDGSIDGNCPFASPWNRRSCDQSSFSVALERAQVYQELQFSGLSGEKHEAAINARQSARELCRTQRC